jgi:hypothetical protein
MRKHILLFLLIISAPGVFAQNEPKKLWDKSNPLQWSDFTGPVDASSKHFAHIYCGSNYKYKWVQKDGKYTFTFDVTGNMTPSKSWTKVEKQSPELLRHEQIHFDIAEFFARQMLAAFNSFPYTLDFENEINQIKTKIDEERSAMQLVYDKQTNHFLNKEMQARWELYVADLLSHDYKLEEALLKEPSIK